MAKSKKQTFPTAEALANSFKYFARSKEDIRALATHIERYRKEGALKDEEYAALTNTVRRYAFKERLLGTILQKRDDGSLERIQ